MSSSSWLLLFFFCGPRLFLQFVRSLLDVYLLILLVNQLAAILENETEARRRQGPKGRLVYAFVSDYISLVVCLSVSVFVCMSVVLTLLVCLDVLLVV